jgi:hypothetical protein
MKSRINRRAVIGAAAFTLIVSVAATGGFSSADRGEALVATNDTATTSTVRPVCADQGDGEVWVEWNVGVLDCDVDPPQTLNYFNVPATDDNIAQCELYGGTYMADAEVCYAVDY